MFFPFVGEAYKARSISIDCQECMNLYPEIEKPNSKNVVALIGTAGMKPYASFTLVERNFCRCLYTASNKQLFAAIGNGIYSVKNDVPYFIGSISTILGYVSMTDNGNSVLIVDGKDAYLYNLKSWVDSNQNAHQIGSFESIKSEAFPYGATHCRFKDGRFIVNEPNSGRFWWSPLYDGAVWNGLDYATAEGSPDNLQAIWSTSTDLWLFGDQSTEVWTTSGDPDLPFIRMQGALINVGIEAPFSVCNMGNTIFWLGANTQGNATIYSANGYQPEAVSNHGIEWMLSQMNRRDSAVAYCYQQEGHEFYVINFLDDQKTLCFDIASGMWHERGRWNGMRFEAHRGVCHTIYNGKNLVGDRMSGEVFQYDLDYFLDGDEKIRRVRSCPHLHQEMKRVFYYKFELDLQKGIGLTHPNPSTNFN